MRDLSLCRVTNLHRQAGWCTEAVPCETKRLCGQPAHHSPGSRTEVCLCERWPSQEGNCVLAMLVPGAQMSPFHLFPKVPFSIVHQPGGSLGFSVIKAAHACIYWLVYSWALRQVQDRDRGKTCLQDKNTSSLSCCIGSPGAFR